MIVLLVLISFVYSLNVTQRDTIAAFYSPASRFWELLLGSLLGCRFAPRNIAMKSWQIEMLANIGISIILFSCFWLKSDDPFPGWYAVPPVFGTVLVIFAGPQTLVSKVLSWRPLVWVGLISFPLYLWHWPLLSFVNIFYLGTPSRSSQLYAVLLSVVLALLTYYFFERKVRFSRALWVTPALCLGALSIALAGFFIHRSGGLPTRFPKAIQEYATYQRLNEDRFYRLHTCLIVSTQQTSAAFQPDCVEANFRSTKNSVLLFGDSHAAHLYPGLLSIKDGYELTLAQLTYTQCHVGENAPNSHCDEKYSYVLEAIQRLQPKLIIIAKKYNNLGEIEAIARQIREFKQISKAKIIMVGPVPQWNPQLPDALVSYYFHQMPLNTIPYRMFYRTDSFAAKVDEHARSMAQTLAVSYFSPINYFCNKEGCLTRYGDAFEDLTSWDSAHLTVKASVFAVKKMFEENISTVRQAFAQPAADRKGG